MADLTDVMDQLNDICRSACYPDGLTSLTGRPIDIAEGWPLASDLDQAMKTGRTLVTIYAIPGGTDPGQVPLDRAQVITPPQYGLSVIKNSDQSVSISGKPATEEYLTLIVDRKAYSAVASVGWSASLIAADLASQIAKDFPGTTATNGTVTIVGNSSITARRGAPGTMGKIVWTQAQQFRVTVWAPSPTDRAVVSRNVDVALKAAYRLYFPDTSTGIMRYQGTYLSDREEQKGEYRRDLIFTVTYDTVDEWVAYEITTVGTPLQTSPSTRKNFNW